MTTMKERHMINLSQENWEMLVQEWNAWDRENNTRTKASEFLYQLIIDHRELKEIKAKQEEKQIKKKDKELKKKSERTVKDARA